MFMLKNWSLTAIITVDLGALDQLIVVNSLPGLFCLFIVFVNVVWVYIAY